MLCTLVVLRWFSHFVTYSTLCSAAAGLPFLFSSPDCESISLCLPHPTQANPFCGHPKLRYDLKYLLKISDHGESESECYVIWKPEEKIMQCFTCNHHTLLHVKLSKNLVLEDMDKNSFVQILCQQFHSCYLPFRFFFCVFKDAHSTVVPNRGNLETTQRLSTTEWSNEKE